jgi:hypothetical protein
VSAEKVNGVAILDLDLDFFVSPAHHWVNSHKRLPEGQFRSASPESVEEFLERQCGLSKSRKIPGRFCVNHDEAFAIWKTWFEGGVITAPFDVYHVDAHADMGLGDSSWTYLLTPSDIHTIFFRYKKWQSGPIELPHYSEEQMERILMAAREVQEPLYREPAVPNTYVAWKDFQAQNVSHMILAQSPGYTPTSADALIPVIEQYFISV